MKEQREHILEQGALGCQAVDVLQKVGGSADSADLRLLNNELSVLLTKGIVNGDAGQAVGVARLSCDDPLTRVFGVESKALVLLQAHLVEARTKLFDDDVDLFVGLRHEGSVRRTANSQARAVSSYFHSVLEVLVESSHTGGLGLHNLDTACHTRKGLAWFLLAVLQLNTHHTLRKRWLTTDTGAASLISTTHQALSTKSGVSVHDKSHEAHDRSNYHSVAVSKHDDHHCQRGRNCFQRRHGRDERRNRKWLTTDFSTSINGLLASFNSES